jgi:hypothetical protein
MSEFLPACHNWPPILMGAACALAAFVIARWARAEEAPLPKWRWGDAPRRPKPLDGVLAHIVGMFAAAFAISYAVNHPFCG